MTIGTWSGTRVVWRWQGLIASNPSTCYLGFLLFTLEDSIYKMAVWIEDTDKAIAEVIGSFDGVEEVIAQQNLYSKERHIDGLADQLWQVTAVTVTNWHMSWVQYDGIYELPEESHYFSYLAIECTDWIAHEGVMAEKHFMYMSFGKWRRPIWRLQSMVITPSFLPTLRPLFLIRSGGKWFRRLYIRPICLELSQMRLM